MVLDGDPIKMFVCPPKIYGSVWFLCDYVNIGKLLYFGTDLIARKSYNLLLLLFYYIFKANKEAGKIVFNFVVFSYLQAYWILNIEGEIAAVTIIIYHLEETLKKGIFILVFLNT